MPLVTPGFDPTQAEYPDDMGGWDQAAVIGGLIAVGAYTTIGIGAFFTFGAAAAAPAVPLTTYTVTYTATNPITGATVTGVQTWCTTGTAMTQGQAAYIAAVSAQGLNGVAPTVVTPILQSFGLIRLLSLEGLLALASFNSTAPNPNTGLYFGGGYHTPGNPGGGAATPPGFPGFGIGPPPETIYPGMGHLVCYRITTGFGQEETYCQYEF